MSRRTKTMRKILYAEQQKKSCLMCWIWPQLHFLLLFIFFFLYGLVGLKCFGQMSFNGTLKNSWVCVAIRVNNSFARFSSSTFPHQETLVFFGPKKIALLLSFHKWTFVKPIITVVTLMIGFHVRFWMDVKIDRLKSFMISFAGVLLFLF